MQRLDPQSRRDAYGSRINREPSAVLVYCLPIFSIALGSALQFLPITSTITVLPPLGFLLFIGWRFIRPEFLPVWAGLPLGLFDDLFSGQPIGTGLFLWSITLIVLDILDVRFPWRNFLQNWLTSAIICLAYLILTTYIANKGLTDILLLSILPQIILTIALFPLFCRLVARLDRLRLTRIRVIKV